MVKYTLEMIKRNTNNQMVVAKIFVDKLEIYIMSHENIWL